MTTLTGVIFDYSCLLLSQPAPKLLARLQQLLTQIKSHGLKLIVFSTHPQDFNLKFDQMGLPRPDLIITEKDTGKRKGSPEWIYETARRFNVSQNNFLMVGDDSRDWRSAINTPTIYIHAKWAAALPQGVTAIATDEPEAIWRFITHFLLTPPRWEYSLDIPELHLHVRSLLGSNARLPASKTDTPRPTIPPSFTLQDIFTYENKVQVGKYGARDLLMLHAITSLYLEGLISRNSYFAVYPSSTPGKISPLLKDFLKPVSKIFHGYFKEDLLFRAKQAVDSSLEKAKATRAGRVPNIPNTNQTNTVHLHPDYISKLDGRSIVVVDDFTTTGSSLEWARNLLKEAGVRQTVLLTIGKYPMPYVLHELKGDDQITPFHSNDYDFNDLFSLTPIPISRNSDALQIMKKSFTKWLTNEPYPVMQKRQ